MSVQIDNKKMWESLLNPKHHSEVLDSLKPWIKDALKEQGLEYKDGSIISIKKQKIIPERWYICKKAISVPALDNHSLNLPVFCEGESTTKEKVYKIISCMTEEQFYEHFRLATEEEIRAIVSIKPEPLSPAPQRNNYDEIKQAEPKQENSPILSNSSNTAKNELTEFEKELVGMITFAHYGYLEKMKWSDWTIARAKDLLSIARKEIAEGINTEKLIKQWEYKKIHSNGFFSSERDRYKEGVEDTIKKIKEG